MVEEVGLQEDDDNDLIIFACQVLEYQPEPSNQWRNVGHLETERSGHAVLSISSGLLPCLEGCLALHDWFDKLQRLSSFLLVRMRRITSVIMVNKLQLINFYFRRS